MQKNVKFNDVANNAAILSERIKPKWNVSRTERWAESDRSTAESDEVPVSEFARAAESVALERILLLPLSASSLLN